MTIVEFLNARYGEIETMARGAAHNGTQWRQRYPDEGEIVDESDATVVFDEGAPTQHEARHIAHHDPAYVLADIASKRAVLALHHTETVRVDGWGDNRAGVKIDLDACRTCGTYYEYPTEWPCATLRALAEPFSGHPDYREEWATPC